MRFGVNTFLFVSPFTNESTKLFKTLKGWGFDSAEISLEQQTHLDPAYVKGQLDKYGLVCGTLCGVFGPDRDLRGTPEQQRASLDYLFYMIDACGVLGCRTINGPMYSAVGRAKFVPHKERQAQWKLAVKNLKKVSAYAEKKGVTLAIEPLNRFETDFINTCEQALKMVKDVGSPALKIQLDTFHMNIEEKDSAAAVLLAGKHLAHFHACGCDRGQPGNDHINWPAIAAALKKVGYDGDVVIESFTEDVKVIANAASIWRKFEPSQKDIAVKGLQFLKKTLA
jgi:D-psicose/D-tagatose/L-ribulose 3-epimerase